MTIDAPMIEGLCKQSAYSHPVQDIVVIETHISWVLLTGNFAYKIKKPVNFGFLDFSTLEKRHFYCQEELRLNRRFAEQLYLAIVPVTGSPQRPIMEGSGTAFEYAVKMKQFPSCITLAQLAQEEALTQDEIDQLARLVADFHLHISIAERHSPYGENLDIKKWFDENFEHIKARLREAAALSQIQAIEVWGERTWKRLADFMQQRKHQGFVRECHGDLHLGNMTLIDGKVVLFDCIEFNPMLRWIDVISEVAFLLIDLLHAEYRAFAFRFLNRYLSSTGDYTGLRLLRYYLVYRALVRAKVTLLRLEQQNASITGSIPSQYHEYADLADSLTQPQTPWLILVHGFSGSGKTWLSSRMSERLGAIHLRSDVERKRLYKRETLNRSNDGIGKGLYSASANRQTYRRLAELAKDILISGFSVIVDAAFLKMDQRQLFSALADECDSKLILLDCQASEAIMCSRIAQRSHQNDDPSDASQAVLMHQMQTHEEFTAKEREYVVRIDTESANALDDVLSALTAWYREDVC